jgi:anaerobic glycerol-3-phosphate dehydrogenase
MNVVVVGGGAAGVAAAWAARRGNAEVTLIHARGAAAALYSGALELDDASADHADLLAFATAFEAWDVGERPRVVVTDAGMVRRVRGRDVALLDLEALAGKRVAVADTDLLSWDGRALARALTASSWAVLNDTRFEAVPIHVLDAPGSRHYPPFDVAKALDAPSNLEALADRLEAALGGNDGWLLGPWLGTSPRTVAALRTRIGPHCGEVTSAPGGAAGARFDSARSELLSDHGVRVVAGSVVEVSRLGDGFRVHLATKEFFDADAVIIAVGGVVSGGVRLVEAHGERSGRFGLALEAPLALALDGCRLDGASSLHGVDIQALGLESLERVGVLADGVQVPGQARLFVAGDVVAGAPHTVLDAARSGVMAGRRATAG